MSARPRIDSPNLRFAQRFECKNCNVRYEEPEPRLFSFDNPDGACPKCQGFGNTIDFDLDLVIPDKLKTLAEGAIEPWTKPKVSAAIHRSEAVCESRQGFPGHGLASILPRNIGTGPQRRGEVFWVCAGSSPTSSARNTNCMCAYS